MLVRLQTQQVYFVWAQRAEKLWQSSLGINLDLYKIHRFPIGAPPIYSKNIRWFICTPNPQTRSSLMITDAQVWFVGLSEARWVRLRSVPSFLLAQQPRAGHELFSAKRLQKWYAYTAPCPGFMKIHGPMLLPCYWEISVKLWSFKLLDLLDSTKIPTIGCFSKISWTDWTTSGHPIHKIMVTIFGCYTDSSFILPLQCASGTDWSIACSTHCLAHGKDVISIGGFNHVQPCESPSFSICHRKMQ